MNIRVKDVTIYHGHDQDETYKKQAIKLPMTTITQRH